MKSNLPLIFLLVLFSSCATTKKIDNTNLKLTFLDEFVLPADTHIDGTVVGGLSGIDYHEGYYYIVCDQPSKPRFYKAEIPLQHHSIDTLIITKMINLDKTSDFFDENQLDLEAIQFDAGKDEIVISSEGSIQNKIDPSVFTINPEGDFLSAYNLPDYFNASGDQKPRNNGVFEGLAKSFKDSGYWVATELPLEKDGPKPKIFPTNSPVRITLLDAETKKPSRQFAYELDGISKFPINYFAINGLTEILEYEQDKFLVLERAFSAGYGSHGNTVKIFDVDASEATNILNEDQLRKANYKPAKKRLVFNFKSVKNELTDKIIDNIEGMTFGPVLPNGNQSLLLISDNNFNSFTAQINQFILLEVDFMQ